MSELAHRIDEILAGNPDDAACFEVCEAMRRAGYQLDADSKRGKWAATWTMPRWPGGYTWAGSAEDEKLAVAILHAARAALREGVVQQLGDPHARCVPTKPCSTGCPAGMPHAAAR